MAADVAHQPQSSTQNMEARKGRGSPHGGKKIHSEVETSRPLEMFFSLSIKR